MVFIGKAFATAAGFAGTAMQAFALSDSCRSTLGIVNPQMTALITQLNLAGGAASKAGAGMATAGGSCTWEWHKRLDAERAEVQRHLAGCSACYCRPVEAFARFQRLKSTLQRSTA